MVKLTDVIYSNEENLTVTGNAVVIAGDSVSIKENKECEHEFRTYSVYSPEHSRTLGSSECRKCGELYR